MYDSDMSTDSNEIKFLIDCEFNFQRISNEKWDAHTELLVHNCDPNIFHTPNERKKKSISIRYMYICKKKEQKNITTALMHQHRTKAGVNTSSCSDDDFAAESHAHTSTRTLIHIQVGGHALWHIQVGGIKKFCLKYCLRITFRKFQNEYFI